MTPAQKVEVIIRSVFVGVALIIVVDFILKEFLEGNK